MSSVMQTIEIEVEIFYETMPYGEEVIIGAEVQTMVPEAVGEWAKQTAIDQWQKGS